VTLVTVESGLALGPPRELSLVGVVSHVAGGLAAMPARIAVAGVVHLAVVAPSGPAPGLVLGQVPTSARLAAVLRWRVAGSGSAARAGVVPIAWRASATAASVPRVIPGWRARPRYARLDPRPYHARLSILAAVRLRAPALARSGVRFPALLPHAGAPLVWRPPANVRRAAAWALGERIADGTKGRGRQGRLFFPAREDDHRPHRCDGEQQRPDGEQSGALSEPVHAPPTRGSTAKGGGSRSRSRLRRSRRRTWCRASAPGAFTALESAFQDSIRAPLGNPLPGARFRLDKPDPRECQMPRLRRVDASRPGISRRRRGRGFEYLDTRGRRVADPELLARVKALAIPPAWQEVWICPHPMGHIQATGVDAAGRTQYRYHDKWRERRDQEKFDAMIEFARVLPRMRERVDQDVRREAVDRDRVLGCAVRLLEQGFFRIGNEEYATEGDSVGLATMLKRHVAIDGDVLTFDYPSKSGKRRVQSVVDREVREVIAVLRRRRQGHELLAYKERGRWTDVKSEDINEYLKAVTGGGFSAKDFRTWNATVLAAVALAVSGPASRGSKAARERAMRRAVEEVAHYLGNTPAVCRASYIDPRVFDRFRCGFTIAGALPGIANDGDLSALHGGVEKAVLDLLVGGESGALEKAA
jgi:DNA topoisomerase-1